MMRLFSLRSSGASSVWRDLWRSWAMSTAQVLSRCTTASQSSALAASSIRTLAFSMAV
ncbi:hypothetical protein D3C85_1867560 [compost metagenome]